MSLDWMEQLDWRRVGDYQASAIPNLTDEVVRSFLRTFENSSPEEQQRTRRPLSIWQAVTLGEFAERMATMAVRTGCSNRLSA
jgi:hypothetical protein